mgnify:CR=1 FL=1
MIGPAGLLGAPVQIAYAVPDARLAAQRWATEFGAGPFLVRSHIELTDVVYRGHSANFDHTSAYGQWGDVMVELVEDHGTGPSVVRERFAADQSGLHHMAFFVDDLDAASRALGAIGIPTVMTAATAGGTRFRFADSTAMLGHMLELYQHSDRLAAFYAAVADAASGWDGRHPVREI